MEQKLTSQEMIIDWEIKQKQDLDICPAIILNRIKTPDGTILTSRFRHDYVTHIDKNGLEYMVDGGFDYIRRNVHSAQPYIELSVTSNAPFIQIRESLYWGSFGKSGKDPLKYLTISEMEDDHLKAVIKLKMGAQFIRDYMERELIFRKNQKLKK